MQSAITKAVKAVGGQAELAKLLKISPQAVNKWVKRGRVPSERVLDVERATGGKVRRRDLRPDLYPDERTTKPISSQPVAHRQAQP